MKNDSYQSQDGRKQVSAVLQRTKSLAHVVHHELQVYEAEPNPKQIQRRVDSKGFHEVMSDSAVMLSDKKWSLAHTKLRAIHHLVDKRPQYFLSSWLRVCAQQEETLNLLYEREASFIRFLWKRGPGEILFQVEDDGVHTFALEKKSLALANKNGLSVYSFQTGARYAKIILSSIQQICFVDEHLYISCSDGMYHWDGASCTMVNPQRLQQMESYAGWLATHAQNGSLRVLHEAISFHIPYSSSVLSFCYEGLSVAVGTEDGMVFLCHEHAKEPLRFSVPSSLPITAICWRSRSEMWLGDEEGGVWYWNGRHCSFYAQYHSRIMDLGVVHGDVQVITMNGMVVEKGEVKNIPDPFSVRLHDSLGLVGLFPHHRFCHMLATAEQAVEEAFLDEHVLWLFGKEMERILVENLHCIYKEPNPFYCFVAMQKNKALASDGGIWSFSSQWEKIAQCTIYDHQKSWFWNQNIYVLGRKGIQIFTLDGVLKEYDQDVYLTSTDGAWRLNFDGTLYKNESFIRHFVHKPTHMIVLGAYVVVTQGAVVSVLDCEHQQMTHIASDTIVCIDGWREYVVMGCQDKSISVINIETQVCMGKYFVSAAIKKIQFGTRMRILVQLVDGSVELLMLDGIPR